MLCWWTEAATFGGAGSVVGVVQSSSPVQVVRAGLSALSIFVSRTSAGPAVTGRSPGWA